MTTMRLPDARAGAAAEGGGLYLSVLAGRYLVAPGGQRLGRLSDVIARLCGTRYPVVTGLVAKVARRAVFIPVGQVSAFADDTIRLWPCPEPSPSVMRWPRSRDPAAWRPKRWPVSTPWTIVVAC